MTTGAFSQNVGELFSELKLVTDIFIYAEANWEATESLGEICFVTAVFTRMMICRPPLKFSK